MRYFDQPPVEHRNLLAHDPPSHEQWVDDGGERGAPSRSSRTRNAGARPSPFPATSPKIFSPLRIWLERSIDTPIS
jgi:hypothetical protein